MKIASTWTGYRKVLAAGGLNGDGYGDLLVQDRSNELWRYEKSLRFRVIAPAPPASPRTNPLPGPNPQERTSMHTDFLVDGRRDRRDERPTLVRNCIRTAPHGAGTAERAGIRTGRRTS